MKQRKHTDPDGWISILPNKPMKKKHIDSKGFPTKFWVNRKGWIVKKQENKQQTTIMEHQAKNKAKSQNNAHHATWTQPENKPQKTWEKRNANKKDKVRVGQSMLKREKEIK